MSEIDCMCVRCLVSNSAYVIFVAKAIDFQPEYPIIHSIKFNVH